MAGWHEFFFFFFLKKLFLHISCCLSLQTKSFNVNSEAFFYPLKKAKIAELLDFTAAPRPPAVFYKPLKLNLTSKTAVNKNPEINPARTATCEY